MNPKNKKKNKQKIIDNNKYTGYFNFLGTQ